MKHAAQQRGWKAVPGGVWALGFVSMLMDISSEMIHALLPIYMVTVLGTSALSVGFIEGIAEAVASVTKVFSGAVSDRLGKRKILAVCGYGLGALTKPVFPLAGTLGWLVGARFVDRIGKGIRGAPRDALVADITPAELRGAAFGLRQTLDTIGAFLGPLLVIGLMWLTADSFQSVFWIAVIPAFLAVFVLIVYVKDPAPSSLKKDPKKVLKWHDLVKLGSDYWWVAGVGGVFALARFSEAFLILRADAVGIEIMWTPIVLVLMSLAFSISAYPAGALSDRINRISVLGIGLVLLIAADLVIALVPGLTGLLVGVVLWGLHMGFTQGLFAALIADCAPTELRGTAFGMFNLLTGIALFIASVVAGLLWDVVGFQGTFLVGAGFAVLTAVGLVALKHKTSL
ncbi:MFS transporter [Paenalcaligenes sp. Me131]|uniref:MFS transporter n=1 Tax=Paenalcaligenes sp. Me131 TaxID=3392636 RepID=UPI003D2D3A58